MASGLHVCLISMHRANEIMASIMLTMFWMRDSTRYIALCLCPKNRRQAAILSVSVSALRFLMVSLLCSAVLIHLFFF